MSSPTPSLDPMIAIHDLAKSFDQAGTRIDVLNRLDLSLDAGQTLAIIGESGSGKSTLLSLLAGLDQPTSGSIQIDRQDLTKLSEEALTHFRARTLGIVFQQFHLMSHLTALENVSLPLEIADRPDYASRAQTALAHVGLLPRATHLPAQLSGGERQRVAIARAFVNEPKLLLADEPSGNLDAKSGRQVMDLLFDRVRERRMTLILVTHNTELASRCDRVLRLEGGCLVPVI